MWAEGWFKLEDGGDAVLFTIQEVVSCNYEVDTYQVTCTRDGIMGLPIGTVSSTVALYTGNWFHVALAIRPDSLDLFINGDLDAVETFGFGAPTDPTEVGEVWIGGYVSSSASRTLIGYFDDFVLSKSAYTRSYFGGFDPTAELDSMAEMVVLLRFDEGAGTTTYSEVGGEVSGALRGSSTWAESTKPTSESEIVEATPIDD